MEQVLSSISIKVNDRIYLKDPESTDLGARIINESIDMINNMGFETLTFRKLAKKIDSTEASVYRYFESKHKLLLYLISWYWSWMEYKLVFQLANINSSEEKLSRAINLLTERITKDSEFTHINEIKLAKIIISESSKVYLTKEVDSENKEGFFMGYKKIVGRVSDIILEINPDYKYPHMLVSTVIEGIHHERYFAQHLPKLTNVIEGEDSISEFYKDMVFKTLGQQVQNNHGKHGK